LLTCDHGPPVYEVRTSFRNYSSKCGGRYPSE
jgi:hypothetical protein